MYKNKMLWILRISIGLVIFTGSVKSVRVCKTFSDYYVPKNSNCWENTDTNLNASEIIRKWGHTAEEYYLTTDDGYKLLIIRTYSTVTQSTPVVVGHGINMNCLGFIDTFNKSLTYNLNKAGYEVWLINFRGTLYSRRHVNLTIDDLDYWKFSFHELGIYDLAKILEFVHQTTHQKSVYIGYSMGTTSFYVYSSLYPEKVNQQVERMISLAPVAYLECIKSIFGYLAPFSEALKTLLNLFGKGYISSNSYLNKWSSTSPMLMFIYECIRAIIFGDDFSQMDPLYTPVTQVLNNDFICLDVLVHYSQLIISGKFQQRDFGYQKNINKYGQPYPPLYDSSKINISLSMYVGPNDWLATPKNAEKFCRELGPECILQYIRDKKWNHSDFVKAKDLKPKLNDLVVEEINNYTSE